MKSELLNKMLKELRETPKQFTKTIKASEFAKSFEERLELMKYFPPLKNGGGSEKNLDWLKPDWQPKTVTHYTNSKDK